MRFRRLLCVRKEIDQFQCCELLSNNSRFVGQLYIDKSLALHEPYLIFTTDLIITQKFTARAVYFLNIIILYKTFIDTP